MGFRKMYDFKDFLAVSYTGETPQQDLNAKKRHRMVGMWEDAAKTKELPHPSLGMKRDIVGEDAFDAVDESPAHKAVHSDYMHLKLSLPDTVDKYDKIHTHLKKKHGSAADEYFKGTPPAQMHHD